MTISLALYGVAAPSYANSTTLVQVPTPSSSTSMTSPFLNQTGCGFLPMPTPWGVPVQMRSPGRSVVPLLRKEIVLRTLKIWSRVLLSCSTFVH